MKQRASGRRRAAMAAAVLAVGGSQFARLVPAYAQPFAAAESSAARYTRATIMPNLDCAALAGLDLREVVSATATEIPAEGNVPAHCRVSGMLAPEIAFEVNLPARWNARFYMIGNGGLAGESAEAGNRPAQRAQALEHGFTMAMTNTGHDSAREPGGTFVLGNSQKAIDYAYRAVHLTAVTAKEIANRYYESPVEYAYWNSCSNGGRQGLIEAQRYAGDFDGIVANAPWVDQTGFTVGALWNQRALANSCHPCTRGA
jgi:feruloyl esterase